MRRTSRWLINGTGIFLLALCIATIAVWNRQDGWSVHARGPLQGLGVWVSDHSLHFFYDRYYMFNADYGVRYEESVGKLYLEYMRSQTRGNLELDAVIPLQYPLGIGIVGVALWICLLRRVSVKRKSEAAAKCRKCGYDLRATPQQCPECGTMVEIAPEQKSEHH